MNATMTKFDAHERLDGMTTFRELRNGSLDRVPRGPGIYVVLAPERGIQITPTSCGGRFKQKDPTVAIDVLRARMVEGAPVVYIGKANNLKRRIREFADFGAGKPIGHWGGRYIWQIEGCQDLTIGWIATPDEDPREVERRLIAEFAREFGRPPFANISA